MTNLSASFFVNLMTITAEIGGMALALQLATDVGPTLWMPVAAVAVWVVPQMTPVRGVLLLVWCHSNLRRQAPSSRLQFIAWDLVDRLDVVITLHCNDIQFDSLWVEQWLRRHVIERIPGGRHAPE